QPDGKVLIGGSFESVNGVARKNIARLNEDGSLDPSFDPGAGADYSVCAILVQTDGRVVLAGGFGRVNNIRSPGLARLNVDGSVDLGFAPQAAPVMSGTSLLMEPDGKILAGGTFCRAGPGDDADEFEYCFGVIRLNPDPPLRLSLPQPLAGKIQF